MLFASQLQGGMGTRKSFPREVSSTASEGVIQREPREGRGTSAILQNCIRNWRKPIGTPEPGEVSGTQIMKSFSCHEKEFGFYLQGRKEPRRTSCEGGSRSDLHVSKVTFAAAWIGLRRGGGRETVGASAVLSNCKVRGSWDTRYVLNSEMGKMCCVLPFTVCSLIVPSVPPVLFPSGAPSRHEDTLSSGISLEVGEEWQGARKHCMHSNIPM